MSDTGAGGRMSQEPPVDPTSDRPLYKQIADWLRDRIDSGVIAVGERLPSESTLMRQFNTTRTTIRRALSALATEGRVYSRRGLGVFVRDRTRRDAVVRQPFERLARHHRESGKSALIVDAESQGLVVRQELLELAEVEAPEAVVAHLGLRDGDRVFLRRRRMWFGDEPTQLNRSYLPLDIAQAPLRAESTGLGGTHARIEELGHRLTHFTERLALRMPTPYEARRLRLDDGVPVVDLVQIAYAGERAVECFIAVMAGDKHRFEYEISAEQ